MAKKHKPKTVKRKSKVLAVRRQKPKKVNPSPRLNTGKRTKSKSPTEVSVSITEMPWQPLDLGPVVLPTKDEAVKVLAELARMNDEVLQAQKRHADSAAQTKRYRAIWDEKAELLSKRLRVATHGSPMPLFEQAERDAEMAAATVDQVSERPEPPGKPTEDAAQTAEDAAGTAVDAPPPVRDDDAPF